MGLQDLPNFPFWEINCTTFETYKNFRIRKDYMGDYKIGYVQTPTLPISVMIASSAGFPILIGPYELKTKNMTWTKDKYGKEGVVKVADKYALWDGGVYDNPDMEALYKVGGGLDKEIDFLIVSTASASIDWEERTSGVSVKSLSRLLEITMSQVDSLRTRDFFTSVMNNKQGMYIKIGNTAQKIADGFKMTPEKAKALVDSCLSVKDAEKERDYTTTLNTPSPANFDLIACHGYENIKCVHTSIAVVCL
jgi:NTE family protein